MSTRARAGVKMPVREKTSVKGKLHKLVTEMDYRSPVTEAYRILKTNLSFKNVDGAFKFIAVTSSLPGEGKTTTTCNLALTLAQGGKKVILVDTDLRKPYLHKAFGLSLFEGLAHSLAEGSDPLGLLKSVKEQNLRILTAGAMPPNPSELLGSTRMKTIIERLGEEADFVVFDCPPILGLNDTLALAPSVDGFLLVVGSGKVPRTALQHAKEQLDRVGAKIIGGVVNGLDAKESKGSYYYNYYQE